MNILVTGASSFAGSHLLDLLLLDKITFGLKNQMQDRNVSHIIEKLIGEGDLTDSLSVKKAIEISQPDQIYHLGALSWVTPSWIMPTAYFDVNASGTINLLNQLLIRTLIKYPPELQKVLTYLRRIYN